MNFVERQVLLADWSVERIVHDYGIDLFLFTYTDRGETEGGHLLLQVKATEGTKRLSRTGNIPFRVERSHVTAWLREPMPVILIVYDAGADCAWWLHIQASVDRHRFASPRRGQATVTLQLPTTQRLTPEVVKTFAPWKNEILARMRRFGGHE